MGERPKERIAKLKGAAILARLRKRKAKIHLTQEQRQRLLALYGPSEATVDELLSAEEADDE